MPDEWTVTLTSFFLAIKYPHVSSWVVTWEQISGWYMIKRSETFECVFVYQRGRWRGHVFSAATHKFTFYILIYWFEEDFTNQNSAWVNQNGLCKDISNPFTWDGWCEEGRMRYQKFEQITKRCLQNCPLKLWVLEDILIRVCTSALDVEVGLVLNIALKMRGQGNLRLGVMTLRRKIDAGHWMREETLIIISLAFYF